jgi:hypothetical protein
MGKKKTLFGILFLGILFLFVQPANAVGGTRISAYPLSPWQSVADQSFEKVKLDAEKFDTLSEWDTSTSRFTALNDGYYQVNAKVHWTTSVDSSIYALYVLKNSGQVEMARSDVLAAGDNRVSLFVSNLVYLDAGDYLEMWVYQGSGEAEEIRADSSFTYFSIASLDSSNVNMDNVFYSILTFGAVFIVVGIVLIILNLKR